MGCTLFLRRLTRLLIGVEHREFFLQRLPLANGPEGRSCERLTGRSSLPIQTRPDSLLLHVASLDRLVARHSRFRWIRRKAT